MFEHDARAELCRVWQAHRVPCRHAILVAGMADDVAERR
ncbi:SWIM zinc finger family protein [Rhizobium sp. BT03]